MNAARALATFALGVALALPSAASARAAPNVELVPACVNAAAAAQSVLALHNKHCVTPVPPPPPPPVPTCTPVTSVNIYAGPTGSFTCGSISDGVISLAGDATLYPQYVIANVQLYLQLSYAAGYYPLATVPVAVSGADVVVDVSSQLASICASFPLASRQLTIDSVQLLTSAGMAGWFVHVYTSSLAYTCQ